MTPMDRGSLTPSKTFVGAQLPSVPPLLSISSFLVISFTYSHPPPLPTDSQDPGSLRALYLPERRPASQRHFGAFWAEKMLLVRAM